MSIRDIQQRKIIWAGFLGNILETYDLIIYGLLAPTIAINFFNPDNPNSLIHVFFILFFGYLARPIGALLFGFFADYRGRKRAIAYSTLTVGIATMFIGLLPTYKTIGSWAVYLLLLFRCLQGMGLGGEYTNSIIFLTEHSHNKHRGFMSSWATNGNCVGFLIASLVGSVLSFLLEHQAIPTWSWRVPFLLAMLGAFYVCSVQFRSPETPSFIMNNCTEKPHYFSQYSRALLTTLKQEKKTCFQIAAILWLPVTITYLLFVYTPIQLVETLNIPLHMALIMNAFTLLLIIVLTPFFGHWSDKIGRRPILLGASLLFLAIIYPFFWLASHDSHLASLFIVELILGIPAAMFYGVAPVLMVELIPFETRGVLTGFIYNFVASIVGGASPVIALELIQLTGQNTAPAGYVILASIVTLAGLLWVEEPTTTMQPSH